MRVLYSLSHQPDWIEFALQMKERRGWEPVYWLTTRSTDELVKKHFPECVRQKFKEVIQGITPIEFDLYSPALIDENTIREYAFEMDIAIRMMDRLDSGGAFSYNERKGYFIKILNYSLNVVNYFKPELSLFTEVPHHATQYILFVVLKRQGIKTLMFKPVAIYDFRILIYNDISDDPFTTIKSGVISEVPNELTLKTIKEYINRLKADYSQGIPDYMKKVMLTQSHSRTFFRTILKLIRFDKVKNLLDPDRSTNILKLPGKRIEQSLPNRLQLYWFKIKGSLQKKRLKKLYEKLQCLPDLTKRFVFIPLQYQPERTTSPDGGAYVEQFLMINLLRKYLPSDVVIYVKEHTAQFHPRMDGHLGRFEFNYHDIVSLQNVYLIPNEFSSFELIDKCWAVATMTGTVGLEAVVRKKPVLIFGQGCWYRSLPGSFFVPEHKSLIDAITQIEKGIVFYEDQFESFLKRFHELSFVGKLTPSYPVNLSVNENISNISTALERYLKIVS